MLRAMCRKKRTIKPIKINYDYIVSENDCPICHTTNCNIRTECKHEFCESCILIFNKCPTCKHFFNIVTYMS